MANRYIPNIRNSNITSRTSILGEAIVKAGREVKEYIEKYRPLLVLPYKDQTLLEKDKSCALAIAEYLEKMSENKITEVVSHRFLRTIQPYEWYMWKDIARILKNPSNASISELWLTDALLLSKVKHISYWENESDNNHFASEAYFRAHVYLKSFDLRFKSGGVINDFLELPIYIP